MAGYGDDSGFATWLNDNGYALPVGAPSAAVLRNRGSNYIDSTYGSRFLGSIADAAQERQWPRTGVIAGGLAIPSDVVPAAVINASYEAALYDANNPRGLIATGSASGAVVREKVGSLEVQYANVQSDGTAKSMTPLISMVDGMMAPYLRDESLSYLGIWSIGGC